MKIAYLSSSKIPSRTANSIHVMKMCQAFASQGHDVELMAFKGGEGVADDFDHYGVSSRFKVKKFRHSKSRLLNIRYALQVRDYCKKQDSPDIFYGRNLLSLSATVSQGVPFIYESHGPPKRAAKKRLESWLFSRPEFSKLVVISAVLKEIYLEAFPSLSSEDIIVAHDAADMPQVNGVATLRGDYSLNVGYIGQLYAGRGIEIIEGLARRFPQIGFHVIGGMKEDIDFWEAKLKALPNIFLYGFVPPADAPKFLLKMDVLLAPYQETVSTSKWMSPIKVFEYLSAGKAIICSDFPVLREVLHDNENALLVAPQDIDEWASALESVVQDESLRNHLGQNAKSDFMDHYTWDQRAKAVISAATS